MSKHGYPERLSSRSKNYVEDGSSQPTMEVLVETLTGTAFEMTVSPSDTVFAIKSKIFRVEGIPVSQQHLLYNLKELEDASSLREHCIGDGARLRLVLSMRGGPISTRRLPPPPAADAHWRDIERLLDTHREESGEWGGGDGGAAGAGPACKVTVLVFRDGDKVNMVRVLENTDGTYTPLAQPRALPAAAPAPPPRAPPPPPPPPPPPRHYPASYSSSLKSLVEDSSDDGLSGSVQENAVTMGKMLELRRRMETLSLARPRRPAGPAPPARRRDAIQKTRSEETLSAAGAEAEDTFALHDGRYARYEYECAFAERYTLLPPVGAAPAAHSASASALHVRARAPPPPPRGAPRAIAASASASDLRLDRLAAGPPPALSRHRPREHLHLGDERPERDAGARRRRAEAAPAAAAAAAEAEAPAPGGRRARSRCALCRKRLSVATLHRCRCGAAFCAPHRYAEVHGCAYDYKADAARCLRRANPPVAAPKLPEI